MNQQKLLKLVQSMIILKEKLQCPICLDVMQEVIELDCGHKFCEECHNNHKSTQKQVACPLCQKVLKRRSMIYKDSYANVLAKFVLNTCKNIQNIYGCEVEQLRRTLCAEADPVLQVQTVILKQNDRSNTIMKPVEPSISKSKDIKRIRPESKENCEDAFDKLMQSALAPSAFNRNTTRRVYVNKKKVDKKAKYNILEFDNHENKTDVLRWLNDTRNLFDRLTQTQNFEVEHRSPPNMDLASISQEKENNFKSTGIKNVRKSRAKSLDVEIRKPMPRNPKRYSDGGGSVTEDYNIEDINTEEEEVVKKVEEKVLLDMMEDEFLNKLDNELLNTEDQSSIKNKTKKSRMQNNTPCSSTSATGWDRLTKIKKTIKRREKVPKQLNITKQFNQSTAPKNDEEINKTKLVEKKYIATSDNSDVSKRVLKVVLPKPFIEKNQIKSERYLKIVLQKVDISKYVRNVTNEIDVQENKVAFLGKIDLSRVMNKTSEFKAPDCVEIEKNRTGKQVSYDLHKLENYITENIKIMDKSLDSTISLHTAPQPPKTGDKDAVNEHIGTVEELHKFNLLSKKHPSAAQSKNQIETRDDSAIFEDNDDTIFNIATQKINTSDHTTSEENLGINDDIKEIFVPSSQKSRQDIANKTNMVLQHSNAESKRHNNRDKNEKEDYNIDELYALPTQKIQHTCKDVTTKFQSLVENSRSADDLLHLFGESLNECLASFRSNVVDDVENHLHNLQFLVTKFKSLSKEKTNESPKVSLANSAATQTVVQMVDEGVQTEDKYTVNAATQIVVATIDEKVQTENKSTTNAEVQTEEIHCFKCNCDLNNVNVVEKISQSTKTAMESMVSEPNVSFKLADRNTASNISKRNTPISTASSQNELFTATFDNLNFETQELTKNQGVILINREAKSDTNLRNLGMQSNEVLSVDTDKGPGDNLPGSILVCSLDSTNPTCSKKVNKRLTYDQDTSKRFKRIRPPTFDSDSEGEVKAQRKCNRFVRDDLTIEIHTNTERSNGQKQDTALTNDQDTSKRFKRIRPPTSDSDSEGEVKAKKKCNRFVRNDLTIEIQTNTERSNGQKPDAALDSQNSDNVNYDAYLTELMKKYEKKNVSTSSSEKSSKIPPSTKEVISDMVTKCEKMIHHANENIQRIKNMNNNSNESSAESFQTASQSNNNIDDDNMFMDEGNLLKLEKDIMAYEKSSIKQQNSEISDIIGATEELEILPNRLKYNTVHRENPQSASLFSPSENLVYIRPEPVDSDNICCHELNPHIHDSDLERIEKEMNFNKAITPSKKRVKIIENVVLKSQDRKEHMREAEDDLFSDEDIVETTPQKKVASFADRSLLLEIDNLLSQVNLPSLPPKNNLPTPLTNTENFEFDFEALPPPPAFQDDIQPLDEQAADIHEEAAIVDPDTMTTNYNKSSATPDLLSQFIVNDCKQEDDMSQIIPSCNPQYNDNKEDLGQNNLSLTPDKLSQLDGNLELRSMMHSTPVTQRNLAREGLGISPIPAKKSQQSGIIEMAQTSKYTPLSSVTRNESQKHTILTSTPKQKSIWNYVKNSQSSKKEAITPVTETKPCIACTRLTKEQIKSISQLTSKKLATYSPSFSTSVTHMIVAVNENHCVKDYTTKLVSAIAAGIWVLRFNWIEECLRNGRIIPEEPYEALDTSGLPGPRTSRLTRKKNPLFKGFKFYCANPFINTTQQDVEEIIKMLEGKVLRELEDLLDDDGNIGLIIGEGHATQDFELYERWAELYKTVTVDIEWLSKCVGQYKIISIRPYVWCSEDNLGDLGYPPYLIETVPLSFTETF